jgi:hypothetical protein
MDRDLAGALGQVPLEQVGADVVAVRQIHYRNLGTYWWRTAKRLTGRPEATFRNI